MGPCGFHQGGVQGLGILRIMGERLAGQHGLHHQVRQGREFQSGQAGHGAIVSNPSALQGCTQCAPLFAGEPSRFQGYPRWLEDDCLVTSNP